MIDGNILGFSGNVNTDALWQGIYGNNFEKDNNLKTRQYLLYIS